MSGDGSVTVVPESRGQVTFLWGFLAVVSALVVFRAITGDMSGAGLYVAVGLFGALLAGSVLMGVWSLRHPGQVDVSAGSIVHRYRGQPRATTLTRATGELYVRRVVLNAKHPQAYLKQRGRDEVIPLQMFDLRRLEEACLAHGWRFVEDDRV